MIQKVNKWLFMVTSTMVTMLYMGLTFQFGSFFIALLDTFNRDRSSTATIQSLLVGFTTGSGIVGGSLITRYGLHRVTLLSSILVPLGLLLSFFATSVEYLYVTIGIVTGIGNSLGYISAIVVIGRVFSGTQVAFCMAVNGSSIAIGGLVYPYLIDLLLSKFGPRGAFLVLSAVQSNACAFCVLCWINKGSLNDIATNKCNAAENLKINLISKLGLNAVQSRKRNIKPTCSYKCDRETVAMEFDEKRIPIYRNRLSTLKNAIKNVRCVFEHRYFTIILFMSGFTLSTLNGYLLLLLDISAWNGHTKSQGLFSFVVFNITNAAVCIIIGILKRKSSISSFVFPVISSLSGCISGILFNFGTSYFVHLAATCLVGAAVGAIVSSTTMIAVKIIPKEQVPVAHGLQMTLIGILTTGIGPLFGRIRDVTGSYTGVHMTISAVHAIGIVLYSFALLCRRSDNKRKLLCDENEVISTKL